MSRPFSLFLLASALAAILIVAGCGSDSDTPALTKAEFIAQGDALCQKAEKKKQVAIEGYLGKFDLGPGKTLSEAEQEEMVKVAILPPIRTQADGLNDLGVPDEAAATALVEDFDELVGEIEEDPSMLSAGESSDPFGDLSEQARKYGFKTCILYF